MQTSNASWKLVYTDKWGDFYIEEESVFLVEDDNKIYGDIWMKQEHSAAALDDLANKSGTKEAKELAYNMKSTVSHIQINQREWEYRSLNRIIYDKNNKLIHEFRFVEPWHKFKPNSAISAISEEFIRIYINITSKK